MWLELLGWLGSVAFAVSAVPQAWKSYKDGHSTGLSWGFLGLWALGELCMLIYVLPKQDLPLIFNYVANGTLLVIIIYFKVFPRDAE